MREEILIELVRTFIPLSLTHFYDHPMFMSNYRRLTSAVLFFAMVFTMSSLSAATSPTLSNRTFVDTRDSTDATPDPLEGIPKLIDKKQSDGRRFISYKMAEQALIRSSEGPVTVYLQLQMPAFAGVKGGWGESQRGLGTFYGLEIKASQILPTDTIRYKISDGRPSLATSTGEWKSITFNSIINIDLQRVAKTYYFEIQLSRAGLNPVTELFSNSLLVHARFQSARLCDVTGGPVTKLAASRPLWLVAHGKNDGEKSFRYMNAAVAKGAAPAKGPALAQVVSVDWANGASGGSVDLTNGRYFINFGKNMAGLLKENQIIGDNLNWVGHSWGTLVGYETAREMVGLKQGRVKRFVALDPATQAFGGYDDDRVEFKKVSAVSTGVKGGDILSGIFGSETKANTCIYSIRLFSTTNSGDTRTPFFYHNLPRSWFIHSISTSENPYWSFFNEMMLRNQLRPAMPSTWGGSFGYKIYAPEGENPDGSTFDLECHGATVYMNDNANFVNHKFLRFNRLGVMTKARAVTDANGKTKWSYTPKQ